MTNLLLTRGLPASGKTTFARNWVAEDADNRVRVNRDDLRLAVYGKPHGLTRDQENMITKLQVAAVEAALKAAKDVIVDDTNLNAKFAKDWLKVAAKAGAEVEWHDEFLDVPMLECITRDRGRPGMVGAKVIIDFSNRYLANGHPKRPQLDSDALPVHAQYMGTPGKPWAFLVDLDGTVASNGTGRDNPKRGYYDWHLVGGDLPIKPVIDLVYALQQAGWVAIYVSGRDAICYDITRQWIVDNIEGDHLFDLFMRPQGDQRKDSIVKLEIFDREIRDNYDVKLCIDDRNQVVDAYRSIGLTVAQVAPGDF